MTNVLVYETFTPKQVKGYAEEWNCTIQEAEKRLEKLIVV